MLPLLDTQVRLLLLNHIALQLSAGDSLGLHAAGIDAEILTRLRGLSAVDLNQLASMREMTISITLDGGGLKAGLHAVERVGEAKAMETYFIRNGAPWQMMRSLFKLRQKVTLKRRRECGAWRASGRISLPSRTVRESIYRSWHALKPTDLRTRYYQLHQAFPHFSIAVLAAVVREYEATR